MTDRRISDQALAEIVRSESGLIVAALYRRIGDFDIAEESVQDAVIAALRTWRVDGVPPNPGAWLSLTARRQAIDRLRRSEREQRAGTALRHSQRRALLLAESDADPAGGEERGDHADDERIPMLFGCCHPALRVEARLTLMLRAVVGLTTPQIARAFLVSEPTMAQRLVRAKRKIVAAGIGFDVPAGDQRPGRLDDVLTAISLAYNAGYLSPTSRDLTDDAIWLAELVTRSLPDEPEAWGLLALLTALDARSGTRFDAEGRLVLLAIRTGRVGIGSPSPEPRAMWSGRRPAADPGATSCRRRSRRATRRRPLGRTPTGCRS